MGRRTELDDQALEHERDEGIGNDQPSQPAALERGEIDNQATEKAADSKEDIDNSQLQPPEAIVELTGPSSQQENLEKARRRTKRERLKGGSKRGPDPRAAGSGAESGSGRTTDA